MCFYFYQTQGGLQHRLKRFFSVINMFVQRVLPAFDVNIFVASSTTGQHLQIPVFSLS